MEASPVDHGIPQGPSSIGFLGGGLPCSPLDEAMRKTWHPLHTSYVDDIRVLAKTEAEARRAAMTLELERRRLSLIPQVQFSVSLPLESGRGAGRAARASSNPPDRRPTSRAWTTRRRPPSCATRSKVAQRRLSIRAASVRPLSKRAVSRSAEVDTETDAAPPGAYRRLRGLPQRTTPGQPGSCGISQPCSRRASCTTTSKASCG